MNVKAIIFDLDGTLLYTAEDLCDSVNHALSKRGLPEISVEQCISYVGNGVKNLIEQSSKADEESVVMQILADFKVYYKEHMENKTRPYDGIANMLAQLRSLGIKTAVLSNKYDEATKRLCADLLPDMIDYALGECEGVKRKPCPDGVYKILEELGVTPSEAVYVGDSGSDMTTAINSGTYPLAVSWGYRDVKSLQEAGAELVAYTPYDIVEFAAKK